MLCAQKSGVPLLCNSRVSEVAGQGVWRAAAGGGGDLWRGGAGPGAHAGAPGSSKEQIAANLLVRVSARRPRHSCQHGLAHAVHQNSSF